MEIKKPTERQYRFFKLSEFDSKDMPNSGKLMQDDFLKTLDQARSLSGIPYIINSGYRTVAENKRVGGVRNSPHLRGWAADIAADDQTKFELIVIGGIMAGFIRIGVGDNFVHFDCDPKLPRTQWLYNANSEEQQKRLLFVKTAIRVIEFIKSIDKQ